MYTLLTKELALQSRNNISYYDRTASMFQLLLLSAHGFNDCNLEFRIIKSFKDVIFKFLEISP
jgi:hypothetical protein